MPKKAHTRLEDTLTSPKTLPLLQDILYCTALAGKALVQDEFSLCFHQTIDETKPPITCSYLLGVFFRYMVLFPFRVVFTLVSIVAVGFLIILTKVIGLQTVSNWSLSKGCQLLLWCMGLRVTHYGHKPKLKIPHVFVANHTTYLDYLVLSSHKFPHSVIAQKQPGVMSMLLKLVSGAIEFERKDKSNRQQIKENIGQITKSASLLIFPEGTCVNNEYTVMFQKGAFDLHIPVCPVAIKYNKDLADPYWNTRKQSFTKHFVYMATRWKTEASVWWMAPMSVESKETSAEFASRVKRKISERAGLKNLIWNGYLKHCKTPEEMKEMKLWGGLSTPLFQTISQRQ
ncbi:glycerol-3-phosphate O-acyltransferase 3/4 [Nematocida homosporus]|uniref:glycerol-3-phosphate O-acyltransferase 3/4 n=1 Tax=Nematocida homosporus TaxID=1912981 RepID=UPI00221FCA1A|nr:glycerol-3-phosphate O-acyltransferase 3/4 [Nematocida homosporus]KAI5185959.1 glycerol-3-phosphate O-acyltransferase 3/4 [Nematocida homosporus]